MGQVRALPAKVVAPRATALSGPVVVSTLFDRKGAILFHNAAARDDFTAPKDTKRGTSAFVRHFADRAQGRHLFEAAVDGQTVRTEALVHTRAGIVRRAIEISRLIGPDDQTAVVLDERATAPRRQPTMRARSPSSLPNPAPIGCGKLTASCASA